MDLKLSVNQIIVVLDKIDSCNHPEIEIVNPSINLSMETIDHLKLQARELLNEINCSSGSTSGSNGNRQYLRNAENIFEHISFMERIKILNQKIQSYKSTDLHDSSLTSLTSLSF